MEQRGGAFEISGVDDAKVRLRVLVSYFRDQPDVVLVYLFGSHARAVISMSHPCWMSMSVCLLNCWRPRRKRRHCPCGLLT